MSDLAEVFLLAGVHHYIGLFWPVNDDAALEFAQTLYTRSAAGEPAGRAITAARPLTFEKTNARLGQLHAPRRS